MAEGLAVALITEAVKTLVLNLMDVRACVKHNKSSVKEIEGFVDQLNKNVNRVKESLPVTVNGDSIDSLIAKLKEATEFVQSHQRRGFFKSVWSAKDIKEKLGVLRRDLDAAFQMALLLTNLEVALDSGKKHTNFQHEMLRIYECHASDTAQAKDDLQKILGLLVQQIQPMHRRLQSVVDMVENLNQTTETEKFFADVMASISATGDDDIDEEFCDPITYELMCDPVKATDGHTYDRWTIIDHNLVQSPFSGKKSKSFSILCDDISIRARLFEKVPSAETQFRERRQSYRTEALKLVDEGYDADALLMLENVLTWDEEDPECLRCQEVLLERKLERTGVEEQEVVRFLQALDYINNLAHGSVQESTSAIQTLSKELTDVKAIRSTPGALQKLVDLIIMKEVPKSVRECLISSFASITKAEENLVEFASLPGSEKILIDSLANKESRVLQFWAVRTIADLTAAKDCSIWSGFTESSNVLNGLGIVLSEEVEESTRRDSLRALENILEKDVPVEVRLCQALSTSLMKILPAERFGTKAVNILSRLSNQNEENSLAIGLAIVPWPAAAKDLLPVFLETSSIDSQLVALFSLVERVVDDIGEEVGREMPIERQMEGIRSFGQTNETAQKISEIVNFSPRLVPTLLKILQVGDSTFSQSATLLILLIVTASAEGAARVTTPDPSNAVKTLANFFTRENIPGWIALAILGNLSFHAQISASDAATAEVLNFKKAFGTVEMHDNSNVDLEGFWCYLLFSLGKSEENRKAIRATKDSFWTLYLLSKSHSRAVQVMAAQARHNIFNN